MKLDGSKDIKEGDSSLSPLPPSDTTPRPPPSGYRITLNNSSPFPSPSYTKEPICHDGDGTGSPIFLGSAIFHNAVHPCKITPRLTPPCRVALADSEVHHHGRYELLPFDQETMEWVPTNLGSIPAHRRPVQGGYEEYGPRLYHAMATIRDVKVPGKTGEHLVSIPMHASLPPSDEYFSMGVTYPTKGGHISSLMGTTFCAGDEFCETFIVYAWACSRLI